MRQEIGSSDTSANSLIKQSRKGATHLVLRSLTRATISAIEASLSDKPSVTEWKVKLG